MLDVNYGGSTGFGRAYRDRLHWQLGHRRRRGLRQWRAASSPSAGASTASAASSAAAAPAATPRWRRWRSATSSRAARATTASATLAALARDTHKFESRYLDWLIGPYPQEEALYRERSPLYHADRLSKPVIFFQGDEDAVVPPNQTEVMVEALRRKGNPVGYFLFAGEQHGFRKAANIQRCLDAELDFYAIEVFRDRADVLGARRCRVGKITCLRQSAPLLCDFAHAF